MGGNLISVEGEPEGALKRIGVHDVISFLFRPLFFC